MSYIKKKCDFCKQDINFEDKYVELATVEKYNIIDAVYFHFGCWQKYFNNSAMNKAKVMVKNMQTSAIKIFDSPEIKNILNDIKGIGQIEGMLKTPIKVAGEDKLKKRKRNERRKKN